ncbi:hypothetical protein ABLA30_09375 [Xenorhabdus nematophila]|uniref:hypothetical protein n=1 Tax=Xenorhabdus nematophila TaxID=628 RepID=UPI0003275274|nr:hypothetical protein [Xenorhabdus nematophila]CCW32638.1 hypothetical protein XNC3_720003 [Xenorhabdus nematophila F1]
MTEDSVYLISNESGADKCPAGKMALYTNINFNQSEIGDILIISPNIQLDTEQLEGYGFIVGGHDGVSSVVNNMSQNATLLGEKASILAYCGLGIVCVERHHPDWSICTVSRRQPFM